MLTTLLDLPVLAAFSGGILWAILGISFLIFIHEYGHYSACRLTGTRVETFSVGFGPRLFGWESPAGGKRRFTLGKRQLDPAAHAMDFRIALIPLGGYVKMAGENPGEGRTGAPDEFGSKTISQRLLIVCAGVIMNAVTAFVFYAICHGGGLEAQAPIVGSVATGSPAWAAGLQPGDRLLEIDGAPLDSYYDLRVEAAFLSTKEARPIVIERGGRRETVQAQARYVENLGLVQLGVQAAERLRLGSGAAGAAEVVIGPDDPARVGGRPVVGGAEAETALVHAFQRGAESVEVEVGGRSATVRLEPPKDPTAPGAWRLGIASNPALEVREARGAASGLVKGDKLQALDLGGARVEAADLQALQDLDLRPERIEAFHVLRDGAPVTVPASSEVTVATLGRHVYFAPDALRISPTRASDRSITDDGTVLKLDGSPAAGLVPPGSRLLKIQGKAIDSFAGIAEALAAYDGKGALALTIVPPGPESTPVTVDVTPQRGQAVGRLALTAEMHKESLPRTGFLGSVAYGAGRLWRETVNVFRTIGGFFSGQLAFAKNVAGPITLVNVSSKASESGFLDLLWFLANISVMLAVLNVLPIPVLDGGHIMFLLAEKVRGRPLSDATIGRLQLIGLVLLLTLMVFALKNDVLLNFLS